MSSSYSLLCLSHDPAFVLSHEFSLGEIEHVTRDHEALAAHQGCDVVAGRFSYPLVEAGCFGLSLPGTTGCRGCHSGMNWEDSDLLRLLHAVAMPAPALVSHELLSPFTSRCWTLDRLRRLRGELGIASG